MVQSVVSEARGRVAVESEPGRGSIFKLWFPRVERPGTDAPASRAHAAPRSNARLLVIDDDASLANNVARPALPVLLMSGYLDDKSHPDEIRARLLVRDQALSPRPPVDSHRRAPQPADGVRLSDAGLRPSIRAPLGLGLRYRHITPEVEEAIDVSPRSLFVKAHV